MSVIPWIAGAIRNFRFFCLLLSSIIYSMPSSRLSAALQLNRQSSNLSSKYPLHYIYSPLSNIDFVVNPSFFFGVSVVKQFFVRTPNNNNHFFFPNHILLHKVMMLVEKLLCKASVVLLVIKLISIVVHKN